MLLINAPRTDALVPANDKASAVNTLKPFKSSTPPFVTIVEPVAVPSGELKPLLAAPSFNMPALIVVDPE